MDFQIATSRTGENPILLSRINVFLGANGTGKTKLLNEIREKIGQALPGFQVLNIEGGRALQMYDTLELDRRNYDQYRTYEQTYKGFQGKRQGTLQSRLFDGLKTLEQLGESKKIEHSDAVTSWLATDEAKVHPDRIPRRPVDPMERVFETFSDIFPSINLKYYPNDRRLRCNKNGSRYGPTSLSEGEKQVFSVLVDVVELSEKNTVLFVDEPELNLHPSLANKLWSSIESILGESVFIYATHSVSFAMRDAVDNILVLSDDDENIQSLDNLESLSDREKEDLLGNITSLIANKNTLLVEGLDDSFDSIFYNWLIGDNSISPTAVGGCEDVVAIAQRSGKWSRISPNVKLAGVIDRDYKSEGDIKSIEKSGAIILPYHEAESYLCDPQVIIDLSKALGVVASAPTDADIIDTICHFIDGIFFKLAARRSAAKLNVRVGVSVPSKALGRVEDEEQLKQLLVHDANQQKSLASERLDEDYVRRVADDECQKLRAIVGGRNIDELLMVAPGKELLGNLAGRAGCTDANGMARAVRHHLKVDNYPALAALREQIAASF